ncbi:MAG: sigma 54-interacting transcriptional regulator [Proteobacteria bacterium]|jgi:PAS domain S-box-containing protein|nr:sigma 54-interacting transcriptional regulator [Pseudomonadota bacterium]
MAGAPILTELSPMTDTLKILFVDDRGLGLEREAASLLRACRPELAEASCASLAPGDSEPLAAGRSFDVVIALSDGARAAVLAEPGPGDVGGIPWLSGVPAFLHWPIPVTAPPDATATAPALPRERLRELVDELVDHGYLEAIRRERGRMQAFADMMDEGIVIHDRQRRIFFVNRAAMSMTGASREKVLGRDCHEAFPPSGLCGAACQFCGVGTEEGGRHAYETNFVDDGGRQRRIKVTSEPMEIEPGRSGILAVLQDLTEVAEMRRRLGDREKFHGMVGVSAAVRDVFDAIKAVGASDYPVLITGESGTGKELVASAIHQEGTRAGGPFVPVNCGALPLTILESELFGHVRGAFTGAIRDKKGRFELAHGGTLFLDEVGELSPEVQVKLLRVLQERRIERVGGEQPIAIDVRIISATNRDLRAMVAKGRFREDLFYRLCVVPIHLPPLRERREDIPYLVEHILQRVSAETGRRIRAVDDAALELLLAHPWPGNVREQINALQFAAIHCDGEVVRAEHLPLEIRRHRPGAERPLPDRALDLQRGRDAQDDPRLKLTREAVDTALRATGGNRVRAAKMLGVGRATLYRFFDRSRDDDSKDG